MLKGLAAAVALIAALYVVDLGLREFPERQAEPAPAEEPPRSSIVTAHPVLHHAYVPGSRQRLTGPGWDVDLRINALGLRDRELRPEKEDRTFRVLMLGDSFVAGVQVDLEATVSKQLERLLRESPATSARRFEVLSLGVGSYSPLLEYLQLATRGLSLEPDLVILNWDESDLQDDFRYSSLAELGPDGVPVAVRARTPEGTDDSEAGYWEERGRPQLQGDSGTAMRDRLYPFAGRFGRVLLERWSTATNEPAADPADISALVRELSSSPSAFFGWRHRYLFTRVNDQTPWRAHYERTQRFISLARDLCRQANVPFALTVHPYPHQVSDTQSPGGRSMLGIPAGEAGRTAPLEVMAGFGRREAIPTLDMTDAFRAAASERLFWERDFHWAPEGHAVAARSLFEFLLDARLLSVN